MPTTTFSPKQVATALGVSESSVKRWVDSGKLTAAKTAGGHRKVPLPSLAAFIRETGQPVEHPEMLGMVATATRQPIDAARDELFGALIEGHEHQCRETVLGFYQQGESIPRLGDLLIGPAFRRIGEGWAAGTVQVHQERRACEVMMATLHELRRWLPEPPAGAPLAMVATPEQDFAEVPVRLVELTLTSLGWRVVPAGSGLPLSEIRAAVSAQRPRLLCVSATHLLNPADFIGRYGAELVDPVRLRSPETLHVLGGGAVEAPDVVSDVHVDRFTRQLADLAAYVETIEV